MISLDVFIVVFPLGLVWGLQRFLARAAGRLQRGCDGTILESVNLAPAWAAPGITWRSSLSLESLLE